MLGGILWKRANRYTRRQRPLALAVYYGLNYLMSCAGTERIDRLYGTAADAWYDGQLGDFLTSGKLKLVYKWLALPYGVATLVGICAFIVVSLATCKDSGNE